MGSTSKRRSATTHPEPKLFDLDSLPPDCVAIPLTNGGYTLVDEEDLCRVDEHEWKHRKNNNNVYAVRMELISKKKRLVFMHRQLFGLTKEDRVQVDHKNHDGLDNRRSSNLRFATQRQNSTNGRLRKHSSRYRCVSWSGQRKKWSSSIGTSGPGGRKTFFLGYYETEEEAAFAFHVVAPLFRDPHFLVIDDIQPQVMLTPQRQSEIRKSVLAKVKAKLAGGKVRPSASSTYRGVSLKKHGKRLVWRVTIYLDSKNNVIIGYYDSEIEAAYAYSVAARMANVRWSLHQTVNTESIAWSRLRAIDSEVQARINSRRSTLTA